jgi:small GTP-binding protein
MNCLRVAILGDRNVGKTTLSCLLTKDHQIPVEYIPTFGLDFGKVVTTLTTEKIPSHVLLEVWDVGGDTVYSERGRALLHTPIAQSDILIMCYSTYASYKNLLTVWLPFVAKHATNKPMVLAALKSGVPTSHAQGQEAMATCLSADVTFSMDVYSQTVNLTLWLTALKTAIFDAFELGRSMPQHAQVKTNERQNALLAVESWNMELRNALMENVTSSNDVINIITTYADLVNVNDIATIVKARSSHQIAAETLESKTQPESTIHVG